MGKNNDSQEFPASYQQEGIWFHALKFGSAYWNYTEIKCFKGELDTDRLKKALETILCEHSSLRTTFKLVGDSLFQVIHSPPKEVESYFEKYIHSDDDVAGLNGLIEKEFSEEENYQFDYGKEFLMRFKVVKSKDLFYFILTMNHIITDFGSMQLFWDELQKLYNCEDQNTSTEADNVQAQYAGYSLYQREYSQTEPYITQKNNWLNLLPSNKPNLNLSFFIDKHKKSIKSKVKQLPGDLASEIRDFAFKKRVAYSSIFQCAYFLLLYKYSHQQELIIGNMLDGRSFNGKTYKNVLGVFANRALNIQKIDTEDLLNEFLQQVNSINILGIKKSDVIYEDLLRAYNHKNKSGMEPLFQAVFNMIKAGNKMVQLENLQQQECALGNSRTGDVDSDIGITIINDADRVSARLDLNCDDTFLPMVDYMLDNYFMILNEMIANGDQKISALEVISKNEIQFIESNNDESAGHRDHQSIVDVIEDQVKRTPDNIAVIYEKLSMTFRELNEKANQLANYILSQYIQPGQSVAICMDPSCEMLISILAVLKAGGVYVPIDTGYPEDRIDYILKDIEAQCILVDQSGASSMSGEHKDKVVTLSENWDLINKRSTEKPNVVIEPENLMYIMYTSGSTGTPKGVMLEHRSILARILWAQETFLMSENDSVLQKTTFCFDVSVWELIWPLTCGAKIVFAGKENQRDTYRMMRLINHHSITFLHFIPSLLEIFLSELEEGDLKNVKHVFSHGEALKPHQALMVKEKLPGVMLHNMYGPTEAAIEATWWTVPATYQETSSVLIGKPLASTEILLVDPNRKIVPVGVIGEIGIGGVGLSRGYLNRAEQTKERFVSSPLDLSRRLYLTGDMGRLLPDGNVEYLGREDNQVKVRGHRIELGEIEAVIRKTGLVEHCIVTTRLNNQSQVQLIAYVVPRLSYDRNKMIGMVQKYLPEYMIPGLWMTMDALPVTTTGKLDKKALPEIDVKDSNDVEYIAPQSEMELSMVKIWEDLLGLKKIGAQDNFFNLGGDSLLAIRMAHDLHKKFGLLIPIEVVFQSPSVSKLSEYIELVISNNDTLSDEVEFDIYDLG